MPGSRSITDFFKPWTRPKKRPSDCIDEGDRAAPSAASGGSARKSRRTWQSQEAPMLDEIIVATPRRRDASPSHSVAPLDHDELEGHNSSHEKGNDEADSANKRRGADMREMSADSAGQSAAPSTSKESSVENRSFAKSSWTPASTTTSPTDRPTSADLPPVDQEAMCDTTAAWFPSRTPITTTLSETATSSFTAPPSSMSFSKRVTIKGVDMVRNSETESDDFDDTTDSEDIIAQEERDKASRARTLPQTQTILSEDSDDTDDLEDIVAPKVEDKISTARTLPQTPTVPLARWKSLRSSTKPKAPEAPPKYKYSLSSLVTTNKPAPSTDEDLSDLDSPSGSEPLVNSGLQINEAAVAAVIQASDEEDTEKAGRVWRAVERTDALKEDLVYDFFDQTAEVSLEALPFPSVDPASDSWATILQDPDQRRQVFTSGFAATACLFDPLPTEILLWLLDDICFRTGDEVVAQVLQVFEDSKYQLVSHLTVGFLRQRWLQLGGKDSAVDVSATMKLGARRSTEQPLPSGLRSWLEVLSCVAPSLPAESADYVVVVLCRLSLDSRVQHSGSLHYLIHDTISAILQGLDEVDVKHRLAGIGATLLKTTETPALQEMLIASLPATSRRCHRLRRQLALAFTLSSADFLTADLSDASMFSTLSQHLEALMRQMKGTNFTALTAQVAILDVAIDAGFSDRQFKDDEGEKSFNDEVSKLAKTVRELESRIIGGGLSDLSKTTAKAALDRLWYRLQYAVRTQPERQKDLFGAVEEERERKVHFMNKWMKMGTEG